MNKYQISVFYFRLHILGCVEYPGVAHFFAGLEVVSHDSSSVITCCCSVADPLLKCILVSKSCFSPESLVFFRHNLEFNTIVLHLLFPASHLILFPIVELIHSFCSTFLKESLSVFIKCIPLSLVECDNVAVSCAETDVKYVSFYFIKLEVAVNGVIYEGSYCKVVLDRLIKVGCRCGYGDSSYGFEPRMFLPFKSARVSKPSFE